MKHLTESVPALSTTGKVAENSKQTGKQLSVTGSETVKSLTAKPPAENDKSLNQMLKSRLTSCMKCKTKTVFTEHGTDYKEIIIFEGLDEAKKQEAQEILNAFLEPLPQDRILKGLTRLQVICPEREKSEIDKKFRLKIYVEELRKYPADVVVMALLKKYKWFPALAELLDVCDNEMTFREIVKKGLKNAQIPQ